MLEISEKKQTLYHNQDQDVGRSCPEALGLSPEPTLQGEEKMSSGWSQDIICLEVS